MKPLVLVLILPLDDPCINTLVSTLENALGYPLYPLESLK